jgi:anti-anti-sigma regulatory factor
VKDPCTIIASELGIGAIQDLKHDILQLLDGGCAHIVIDLSAVHDIDPAALALIELANERRTPGEIVLVCPGSERRERLRALGFSVVASHEDMSAVPGRTVG